MATGLSYLVGKINETLNNLTYTMKHELVSLKPINETWKKFDECKCIYYSLLNETRIQSNNGSILYLKAQWRTLIKQQAVYKQGSTLLTHGTIGNILFFIELVSAWKWGHLQWIISKWIEVVKLWK